MDLSRLNSAFLTCLLYFLMMALALDWFGDLGLRPAPGLQQPARSRVVLHLGFRRSANAMAEWKSVGEKNSGAVYSGGATSELYGSFARSTKVAAGTSEPLLLLFRERERESRAGLRTSVLHRSRGTTGLKSRLETVLRTRSALGAAPDRPGQVGNV